MKNYQISDQQRNEIYKYEHITNENYLKNNTQIYNILLRITCGLFFNLLHASNFIDYDLLTLSQYDHVMKKLFNIARYKLENSRNLKPVSISELLLFDKMYWAKMCEQEKESILRNKVEFFIDGLPTMVKGGVVGEAGDRSDTEKALNTGYPVMAVDGYTSLMTNTAVDMGPSDWESMFSALDRPPSLILNTNKLSEIWRGIDKKYNYCAQIDESYFDNLNLIKDQNKKIIGRNGQQVQRVDYMHKFDDYPVPHLTNEKRTWKEIDDVELRIDDQSMLDNPPPTSPIRYFLFQDQINFLKYFMNKELIPTYEYFDLFFDSFCKITMSMILSGVNSQNADTNPEILNIKALILMLEPLETDVEYVDKEKENKGIL